MSFVNFWHHQQLQHEKINLAAMVFQIKVMGGFRVQKPPGESGFAALPWPDQSDDPAAL